MQITKTADNPYQKLWYSNFSLRESEPELATICERIIELYNRNLPEDEAWSILSVSDDYGYDDPKVMTKFLIRASRGILNSCFL